MLNKNPYDVLGVSPDASDDEVKKAYRDMSRKYHPDANVNNPLADLAEEKFKEVQEAYDMIMKECEQGGGPNGGYQYGYGYGNGGDTCGTGNVCCDLWCADTLCECMGGDLCSCM